MRCLLLLCVFASAFPVWAGQTTQSEDWSSILLPSHTLTAQPPALLETDNYPSFTREIYRVQWRPADPIYLYIIRPKLVSRPPAIIYLYSYPSEADRFLNETFCELLTKNGVAAIGFVSALTGNRYHDRPMNEWFVSNLQEALGSTVHDVQMILDYLSRRGDLETDHVGIFGEGSGGAIAVLAAAADPRIKAIDLLDPWGDWPDWMADSQMITHDERSAYLSAKYLDTVAPLDPVKWLPRLNIPVRIQYLQQNSTTPQKAQERLLSAAPKQAVKPPREQALEEYRNTGGKVFLDWIKGQIWQ